MGALVKKKLLLLYTKDPAEVYNRKSAIGSYVKCLATLLEDTYDVSLNGEPADFNPSSTSQVVLNTGKRFSPGIKKYIPRRVKSYLRDRLHFQKLNILTEKIKTRHKSFDRILEFYNFGSKSGLELAGFYNCDLHLIYDGPILEEYEFFNGHKTSFEKICLLNQKLSFDKARSITVYSTSMKNYCIRQILNTPEKYVIHQNVDFTRFHLLEQKKFDGDLNLCFIGSFLKWHRVTELIDVFVSLHKSFQSGELHLYLIGDGTERINAENHAKKLLCKNIHFTGFLDGEALVEMQKKMHIGIMPGSNWYGAPNKIFEYGASNMACIAPDTPTIRDTFNQNEVLLFEMGNKTDFRQKLTQLITDPIAAQRYADKLHQFIRVSYTEQNTRNHYSQLLN